MWPLMQEIESKGTFRGGFYINEVQFFSSLSTGHWSTTVVFYLSILLVFIRRGGIGSCMNAKSQALD